MNDFRLSFFCFLALVVLFSWALGLVLYRRIGRRDKGVHVTVGSMAALAFVLGAIWWTVIHPAIWPNPAPEPVNPNAPPLWGLVILAGVAGVICLTLSAVVAVAILGIWDRAVPGTMARVLERLRTSGGVHSPPGP